jgi:tetratricopeptide (TPR) repeat protein
MKKVFLLLSLACVPMKADCFIFGRGPERAAEIFALIDADFKRGDCQAVLDRAPALFSEATSSQPNETVYMYMGACYERAGLSDKAVGLYKMAFGLYQKNYFFAGRLAEIYLSAGFYGEAISLFSKILSDRPDDLAANLGMARAQTRLGFLSRAKTYYSRYTALSDFNDMPAMKEYAQTMLLKRDWREASMLAEKGLSRAPTDIFWPKIMARLCAGQGKYREAIEYLNRSLAVSPGERQALLERALYALLSGHSVEALADSESALRVRGDDPLAALIKGLALFRVGEADKAREWFEAARKGGEPFTAQIAGAFLKAQP